MGTRGADVPGCLLLERAIGHTHHPHHLHRAQLGAIHHVISNQVVTHRIRVQLGQPRDDDLVRDVAIVRIAGGCTCVDIRGAQRLADDSGTDQRNHRLVRVAGVNRHSRNTRHVLGIEWSWRRRGRKPRFVRTAGQEQHQETY